jgi:hypothetical protein
MHLNFILPLFVLFATFVVAPEPPAKKPKLDQKVATPAAQVAQVAPAAPAAPAAPVTPASLLFPGGKLPIQTKPKPQILRQDTLVHKPNAQTVQQASSSSQGSQLPVTPIPQRKILPAKPSKQDKQSGRTFADIAKDRDFLMKKNQKGIADKEAAYRQAHEQWGNSMKTNGVSHPASMCSNMILSLITNL